MARINLLPWREERRKQRQQEFYIILAGAAAVGALLFAAWWMHLSELQKGQDDRNKMLRDEIAILDERIKKIEELEAQRERLLARKNVIEELQKNRSQIVRLFDQLVRTMPDGVRLTAIKQQGDRLTLDGMAESNAKVSAYMRNLDDSDWLSNPDLDITEIAEGEGSAGERYRFTVNVKVGPDTAEGQELEGVEG